MKKKKKIKFDDFKDYLFNSYNNIIEINKTNNKILSDLNLIKQQLDNSLFIHNDIKNTYYNIDFIYDFINIDYPYYKFTKNDKIICLNITKYLNADKNILIPHFNNIKNIHGQLNYFTIKYENFTKKFCKIEDINTNNTNNNNNNNKDKQKKYIDYNISDMGILNYTDLFMLIKDSNCVPFWNEKCDELSKQIFLPSDTNLKIYKTPNTFNYKNWFKTEHKTSLDEFKLNNKKLEIDNKERKFVTQHKNKKTGQMENIIKSHKIKIYFNSTQKNFIKRIFGVYRYFYNRTIQFINNFDKKTNKTFYLINYGKNESKITINLKNVKNKFTHITIRKLIKNNYPEWVNKINFPSHLVDMAIKEAVSSYSGCLVKFNKYKIPFNLKLKTKKDKIQTLNIENTMIHSKTNSLFYNLKDLNDKEYAFRNLKTSCRLNKYLNICDSSVTWNQRTNEFYLNLNFEDIKLPPNKILSNKKICAIDPGIKSFLTIYSDNSVNKIGIGIRERIEEICRDIDIIISKQHKKKEGKYKYNHQKRRALKKALHRKIKYLDNLKEELHNKSVKYLCDNYGKIIIPPFETQKMVSNIKLDSKTSRNLMCISYYKFLSKLKSRCIEYDIELVIRPEYYTSKTCTKCGNIKHDLSNANIYICKNCGIKIDRDTNGARNILLRNLCN
jgi:putative transposase